MLRRNTPSLANWKELNTILDKYPDYTEKRYHAAVWYVNAGIHVVPFKQGEYAGYPKGVTPNTVSTLKLVEKWWHPLTGEYLTYDVALPTGGGSGIVAIDLDVDAEEDKDGITTFAELEETVGGWSDDGAEYTCWIQDTPRGGRHLVFKYHPEIGVSATKAGARFSDIDTRGGGKDDVTKNGGVIFAAPTIKRDKHGVEVGAYRWHEDATEMGDVPVWLIDALKGRMGARIQLPDSFTKGSRDATIFSYLMSCAGAGYTKEELEAVVPSILERMVPRDEKMVMAKLASVLESHLFKRVIKEQVDKVLIGGLELAYNDKGKLLHTQSNLDIILRSAFFDKEQGVYYDGFTGQFTHRGDVGDEGRDIAMPIKSWLSNMFNFETGLDGVRNTMIEACKHNPARPHINSLADYVINCQHSGKGSAIERLGDLLGFKGLELEQEYRRWLQVWLCGAAARAVKPGVKFDYMLILIGTQGCGKSMFLHELAPNPEWFCDSLTSDIIKGSGAKDELLKLQGSWIIEMAELTPLKSIHGQSGDAAIKGFITAQKDKYRAPYERLTADHKRTCVLAGTSNSADIFRDASGSRRYLTIEVPSNHQIDWGTIASFRDDIWHEALGIYNALGDSALWLEQTERAAQNAANEKAYRVTEIQRLTLEMLQPYTRIQMNDIVGLLVDQPIAKHSSGTKIEADVKEILQREGWVNKVGQYVTKAGDTKKARCYHNPNHPYEKASTGDRRNKTVTLYRWGFEKEQY